ncbi:MAG: hypothetical protein LCH95_19445 [Proteobacteria bacterium]|nr:hypothetical protein [Pseudomonadota bacterium]
MELRTLLSAGARLAAAFAFGLGILLAAPDGHAQSDKLKAAFEKDLKESGLSFQKTPDDKLLIYVTSMVRKEGKVDVQVILADSNTVVFQTRIAGKGALKV